MKYCLFIWIHYFLYWGNYYDILVVRLTLDKLIGLEISTAWIALTLENRRSMGPKVDLLDLAVDSGCTKVVGVRVALLVDDKVLVFYLGHREAHCVLVRGQGS